MHGGDVSEVFEDVAASLLLWSPDSTRVAYGVVENDRFHLVVGENRTTGFDRMSLPVFSPSGSRWGCVFLDDMEGVLIVDGEEVARHDGIFGPVFSSDDAQVAYNCVDDDQVHVVLNGEAGPAFEFVGPNDFGFGPHDVHFAYRARSAEGECVVVDSVAGETFARIVEVPIAFSPDGTRYAYLAMPTQDSVTVVVDGQRGETFDDLLAPPIFSPDGRHVAYVALQDGLAYIVVNDARSDAYTGIVRGSEIIFTAPDSLNVLMLSDGEDYQRANVTITVEDEQVSHLQVPNESDVDAVSPTEQVLARTDRRLANACREGNIDTVLERLAEGCEVNSRTTRGETPLHLASRLDDPTIAMILLRAGGDPLIPNAAGELPLDVLKAHELAPSDAEDYFVVIQNRMIERLEWACFIADDLLATGVDLEQLRQELIREDELELQLFREQAAIYSIYDYSTGYDLSMRFWGTDLGDRPAGWMSGEGLSYPYLLPHMEREYYSAPLPPEFYEPLDLPTPPQFAEAGAMIAYAVFLSELTYGSEDPRFLDFRDAMLQLLGF